MAYTAIDDSRSVIKHYGKKGMKWRKNRADIEGREMQPLDVATDQERKDDWRDQTMIKSYKDTQALNGPADYKILEKIYGKNKVTPEILKKFQKNAYGKLIDAKVKSRTDRVAAWKARANKVNKTSSLTTKPQI
jgi:hypothetical protein